MGHSETRKRYSHYSDRLCACLKDFLSHLVPCQRDDFKSWDFWVGGISPYKFSVVGNHHNAGIWTALLQVTYGWEDIYKTTPDGTADRKADKVEEGLRRSMNPGTAKDEHHWRNWADLKAMDNTEEKHEENKKMDED